ncbi:hypothetical protein [Vibrio mediterranei]|uniref:hypothetical protein n=1 Tax=Vibrio mediterranei TaxID=689 RepID=UPI00148B8487|nr:hypothetical protein [Vibrio mediterranei]NOI26881.1 hypothetical protein [Vibrio mediterranei]
MTVQSVITGVRIEQSTRNQSGGHVSGIDLTGNQPIQMLVNGLVPTSGAYTWSVNSSEYSISQTGVLTAKPNAPLTQGQIIVSAIESATNQSLSLYLNIKSYTMLSVPFRLITTSTTQVGISRQFVLSVIIV